MIKETDKLKEPLKLAIKFANTVFVLGILFSILIIIYAIYKIYNPSEAGKFHQLSSAFYIISILCGGVFATLFGFGLKRLNNNLKVNLSVLFFSVGIAVYGFEFYLDFSKKIPQKTSQREIIAKQMNVLYDSRTYREVLDDLRNSGVEAFPNVGSSFFTKSNGLTAKKGRIYPLGTISNSTTVISHNEAGLFFWRR